MTYTIRDIAESLAKRHKAEVLAGRDHWSCEDRDLMIRLYIKALTQRLAEYLP